MEGLPQRENVWMRPMRGDVVTIKDLTEQEALMLFGEGAPFFEPGRLYEVDEAFPSEDGQRLRLKLYENEVRVAGKTYATRRKTPDELVLASRCVVVKRAGKRIRDELNS